MYTDIQQSSRPHTREWSSLPGHRRQNPSCWPLEREHTRTQRQKCAGSVKASSKAVFDLPLLVRTVGPLPVREGDRASALCAKRGISACNAFWRFVNNLCYPRAFYHMYSTSSKTQEEKANTQTRDTLSVTARAHTPRWQWAVQLGSGAGTACRLGGNSISEQADKRVHVGKRVVQRRRRDAHYVRLAHIADHTLGGDALVHRFDRGLEK